MTKAREIALDEARIADGGGRVGLAATVSAFENNHFPAGSSEKAQAALKARLSEFCSAGVYGGVGDEIVEGFIAGAPGCSAPQARLTLHVALDREIGAAQKLTPAGIADGDVIAHDTEAITDRVCEGPQMAGAAGRGGFTAQRSLHISP
ncbi:MAG: hypothetical protein IPK52_18340 [Chloroflexi bacterium]|nr:hypothetical protein [Chloroflexota bacterium]